MTARSPADSDLSPKSAYPEYSSFATTPKPAEKAGLFNALYIHPGGKCESTVQQLGKTCEPA